MEAVVKACEDSILAPVSVHWHTRGVTHRGPTFLVASPSLECPYFGRTVVLLVDHDEEGSFGFVISKPSALTLPDIMAELKYELKADVSSIDVVRGGPVSQETGWVIFDPRGAAVLPGDTMRISDDLAVTASLEMLEAIARGDGPSKAMLALGYAGWGPGQLENEMREGSWLPVDVDHHTLFDAPYDERWNGVLANLGIEPWRVVTTSTTAQA